MANVDTPMGLKPIRLANGAPYNAAMSNPYYVPSTYATALYIGDPIVIVSGGSNSSAVGTFPPGTLKQINRATAGGGNYLSGVIVGFEPLRTDLTKQYNPASTERVVYVADSPDIIFEIQEDSDGTALTSSSAGLNADIVFTHSGNTRTGISGCELDRSTAATTNTLQLKILQLVNREDNAIGDYAKWEVLINLHTQRYTTGI
jgi:hypothetical protein